MGTELEIISDLVALNDLKQAEIHLARWFRQPLSDQERAEGLMLRARLRLISERPEDAISDIEEVRLLRVTAQETPEWQELIADAHLSRYESAVVGFVDRKDTLAAQVACENVLSNYPNYANLGWIYYQLGRVHLAEYRLNQAVECFQNALINPARLPVLTAYCYERLGYVEYDQRRDLNRALALLNRAADTYPSDKPKAWLVQLHLLRSRLLRLMGQSENALSAGELALAIVNESSGKLRLLLPEVVLGIAEILGEIGGREKEVINHLQQFTQYARRPLGVDVTWSRVSEMLGDSYYVMGQYNNALNAYRSSLQFNPDHPWELSLYHRMAQCHYQLGEFESVIGVIGRLKERARADGIELKDHQIFDLLGHAHFALRSFRAAIEAYDAAMEITPPGSLNLETTRSYRDLALSMIR